MRNSSEAGEKRFASSIAFALALAHALDHDGLLTMLFG